jgi:hypothetical protein
MFLKKLENDPTEETLLSWERLMLLCDDGVTFIWCVGNIFLVEMLGQVMTVSFEAFTLLCLQNSYEATKAIARKSRLPKEQQEAIAVPESE